MSPIVIAPLPMALDDP